MASTFFGIELGRRALDANQLALTVVGQNTANINTPGYSRQVVAFEATEPFAQPNYTNGKPGQLGTGVTVAAVNRVRDDFIDRRVLEANSQQGAIDSQREVVSRVEESFNEPGTNGIGQLLTDFFNSFADLSANPESGAIRSTVRNRAETLLSAFRSVNTALQQIGPEIEAKIAVQVSDINDIAVQIAGLNKQIFLSTANGDHPNDLLDKRGQLLEGLSKLANVRTQNLVNPQTGKANGEIKVTIGGYALVTSDAINPLPTKTIIGNGVYGLLTPDNDTIPLQGGSLYGLLKATTQLEVYRKDFDRLAEGLATAVNTIHETGVNLNGATGLSFFSIQPPNLTMTAGSISLNPIVAGDINAIAAAAAPPPAETFAPGNGDNARRLAALLSTPALDGFSLNEYYNAKVAGIGADAASYNTQSQNQERVVNLLKNQQSSISGVSLDEELTRMLQYQRSYQAAARMINVMDAILDRIVNGLGAGRA